MSKMLKNAGPEERKRILFEGADKVEEITYMKRFTPEEIDSFKTSLSEVAIQLDAINVERDEIKEQFKIRTKPLEKELKTMLTYIRDKATSVKEKCAVVFNYEKSFTEYYNAEGELIYSRPMLPDERQTTIFSLPIKEGTND